MDTNGHTILSEDYCSYEVAKLLKEKGFEIDTNKDYWKIGEDGTMYFMSSIGAYTSNRNEIYAIYRPENSYPCPTHQMAMKWLREVYNIDIIIFHEKLPNDCYWARIERDLFTEFQQEPNYKSYEEAVEAALKYALENLI